MNLLKICALTVSTLMINTYAATRCEAQSKPNIVIIISDDHSYQTIGAYGNKLVKTPNIDRIAKEGVLFNKAYVTNSICGPSRAVLLTGRYSHKNGLLDNRPTSKVDGTQDNFAKQLQSAGYQTAWIGKWHMGSDPTGFTFWKILPGQGAYYNPDFVTAAGTEHKQGYVANIVEDESEAWLNSIDKSKPFCLVIGHKSVHRNWLPDTGDLGAYDKVTFPIPANFYDNYTNREAARNQDMTIDKTMELGSDLKMFNYVNEKPGPIFNRMTPHQRAKFEAYYNAIETDLKSKNLTGKALVEWKYQRYMRDYLNTTIALDRNIGRTLKYLDKNNLTKNTIVIYMSDQGFFMGEHGWFDKRWMYEESFRTPMMMRYPGVVKPGSKSNNMVLNLDIAPTLLDAASISVPKQMQGASFLPLVTGKSTNGRSVIYYHFYEFSPHHVSPHFGVKTQRYKLIRFYEHTNAWELYDLQTDPAEMNNLYGKTGYEKITADLKAELKKQIDKYEDTEASKIYAAIK